ncbi:hypothetical protein CEXT_56971 [Caerostris extrusa]|uniref:Uncharacterized protein n=1 Tax=Caerostris extrusa TaxID=172846 RepID=A0AAV4Q8D4_CAEEX|nr:hypothetical protein CEXT_56971 [Caerostris extrusa]
MLIGEPGQVLSSKPPDGGYYIEVCSVLPIVCTLFKRLMTPCSWSLSRQSVHILQTTNQGFRLLLGLDYNLSSLGKHTGESFFTIAQGRSMATVSETS